MKNTKISRFYVELAHYHLYVDNMCAKFEGFKMNT